MWRPWKGYLGRLTPRKPEKLLVKLILFLVLLSVFAEAETHNYTVSSISCTDHTYSTFLEKKVYFRDQTDFIQEVRMHGLYKNLAPQ